MTGAALKTPPVILRSATGEPPLGPSGLAFRDDQGEMFLHDNERYRMPATRLGVLELENGHWLALPPGFHIDAPQFDSRAAALDAAVDGLIAKARKYMTNKEGEGTHWSEGFGNPLIEWAISLKMEKGLDHRARENDAAPIGHPGAVASRYRVSVQFSGGAASYVAAKLILDECGHDGVALIFADTKIEDEDLYRFLEDAEARLQHPIIRISEGRDPWAVFFDERMMGHSMVDPCSKILKRKLLDKWRAENCISDCMLVIGYDASEDFRFQPLKTRMAPVNVRAPLLEQGIWKEQAYAIVEGDGLRLPRLYQMGFPHNNCGGFCVKAGHASFALLLENLPERYAQHEAKEEEFRQFIGKDVSIMRDRRGGVTKPLTMRAFRERHQADPTLVDRSELGGCNCMEEPAEAGVTDDNSGLHSGEVKPTNPSDPIVRSLCEAKRLRSIFPAGHTFSMTNPVINGHMVTLGTCKCGAVLSYPWGAHYELMDAAVEAHWQSHDSSPDKVDGRGHPIKAEQSSGKSPNKRGRPRLRNESPASLALPEPAPSDAPCAEDAGSPLSEPGAGGQSSAPDVADAPQSSRQEPAPVAPPSGAGSPLFEMGELAEFPGWNAHDDFAAIARGEETVDGERVRHYVGTGYVAPTTTRLILTEQGEAFLNPPAPIGAGSMGSLGDGDGGQRPSNGAETSGMDVTAGETASSEAITGTALGSNWPGVQRTPCDSVTAGETAPDFAQTMAAEPSGDWPELFKAAHELAWREPVKVTVTEIQASLLDFGKVYAPGRKVERPILRWHGGKWRLAPWIISHFPTHKVYIEPFGGAGSVLLQKLPAITEVWNDLEGEVVNLFRVLRSNAEDLARLIYLTPFAREEYHSLYEVMDDPLERARQFVARSFMGQSSKGALWKSGFDSRINPDGFASRLNSLRAMPEEFHAIAERFRGVIIEQRPADAIFAQYDRQDVLFYVDPPYLSDRAKHYTHELDEAGHVALLETLRSLAGMVVLSGYRSELYDAALTDWRRIETDAHADGGIDRTEVLWLNPACVAALDAQHPQLFDLASIDAVNTPPRT